MSRLYDQMNRVYGSDVNLPVISADNVAEFRRVRDAIALESMLARGRDLEPKADAAWIEAQALKRRIQREPRNVHLVEAYDKTMATWAEIDAQIWNIVHDSRYSEWAKTQQTETA